MAQDLVRSGSREDRGGSREPCRPKATRFVADKLRCSISDSRCIIGLLYGAFQHSPFTLRLDGLRMRRTDDSRTREYIHVWDGGGSSDSRIREWTPRVASPHEGSAAFFMLLPTRHQIITWCIDLRNHPGVDTKSTGKSSYQS